MANLEERKSFAERRNRMALAALDAQTSAHVSNEDALHFGKVAIYMDLEKHLDKLIKKVSPSTSKTKPVIAKETADELLVSLGWLILRKLAVLAEQED